MRNFKTILICSIIVLSKNLFAQKPPLDFNIYKSWPSIELYSQHIQVTNDGKYIYFTYGPNFDKLNWVIKSSSNKWVYHLGSVDNVSFTTDSHFAVYLTDGSLYILKLGSNNIEKIENVKKFKIITNNLVDRLIYLTERGKKLLVRNLANQEIKTFEDVDDFQYFNESSSIIIKHNSTKPAYDVVDTRYGMRNSLWRGSEISTIVPSIDWKQFVITLDDSKVKAFWLFKSQKLSPLHFNLIDKQLTLQSIDKFLDNDHLLVTLLRKPLLSIKKDTISLDVWSYRDLNLQSEQGMGEERGSFEPNPIKAIVSLKNRNMTLISEDNENVIGSCIGSQLLLQKDRLLFGMDMQWSISSTKTPYLINFITGEKLDLIKFNRFRLGISLTGRFLYGYSIKSGEYLCYDILNKSYTNIAGALGIAYEDRSNGRVEGKGLSNVSVIGWGVNDKYMLVEDGYDIWKVNPLDIAHPVCLTNGIGRKNSISFLPINDRPVISDETLAFKNNEPIILKTYNHKNKDRGFASISLNEPGNVKFLSSGAQFAGDVIWKAKTAKKYIVNISTATESPNYFITNDFVKFKPITSFHPEKNYNWVTTELHNFKSIDGTMLQGTLYKPENFDSAKKYPVILNYYELRSEDLNRFFPPSPIYQWNSGGNLDIPWFVSHEYLVFVPDIIYTTGTPFEGTYKSIMGAFNYLKKFNFIDTLNIGLQGHSWGGYQTNYMITQTKLFKAAVSSSGMSDLISYSGSLDGLNGKGGSHSNFLEATQVRIGATLWEHPEFYIQGSPIFNLDKVNTPVLLVANKKDSRVPFEQGLELFIGLRRLGKRSWMLQYDEGSHGVATPREYTDLLNRMTQFFDHYLKGKPAPVWMTRGIPARMKGIETGLEYDKEIKTPGPGLVTTEEQKKIDEYSKIPLSEKLKRVN